MTGMNFSFTLIACDFNHLWQCLHNGNWDKMKV